MLVPAKMFRHEEMLYVLAPTKTFRHENVVIGLFVQCDKDDDKHTDAVHNIVCHDTWEGLVAGRQTIDVDPIRDPIRDAMATLLAILYTGTTCSAY